MAYGGAPGNAWHVHSSEGKATSPHVLTRALAAVGLALGGVLLWQGAANAQNHRVALVVQHGPDWPGTGLIYKCVEFAQNAISGLELLELAGVNSGQPPAVYDWGGGSYSICQVDHEPRSVPDRCFGPTSGRNWSDWHQTSSGWVARSTGTSG